MKRPILLALLLTTLSMTTLAQVVYKFGDLITGNADDSKYLASGYVTPFMTGLGHSLNNGWYNSSAPHKLGGFDITFTTALAFAPALDKTYLVDNSKMTEIELMSGSSPATTGTVPTAFGTAGAPTYRSPKGTGTQFQGPEGSGIAYAPAPTLGLGIGLPKGFELRLRYVPTVDLNKMLPDYKGNYGLFGVGIMHDIKQWIPGVKALPFDISAFVGYTKMNLDIVVDQADINRKAAITTSATTIQALIGKKLSILTVYGSVGYNIAKTDFGLKGSWDFNNDADTSDPGEKDPFTLQTDSNGIRGTIGMRIRLAVIAFHADYSIQKYRTISGGFGINFR